MTFKKRLVFSVFVFLALPMSSAFADTCYDPRHGYYECYPHYSSYPDQGQTFMEGAVLGLFLGGFLNDRGYEGGGHWGRGYEHRGGHGGGHHH